MRLLAFSQDELVANLTRKANDAKPLADKESAAIQIRVDAIKLCNGQVVAVRNVETSVSAAHCGHRGTI